MLKLIKKFIRDERGLTNLLSATMVLIVLMAVVSLSLNLTLLWNAKIAVQQAAFEAARAGSVAEDPVPKAVSVARGFAAGALPGWTDPSVVTVTAVETGVAPDKMLSVTVNYHLPLKVFNGTGGTLRTFDLVGQAVVPIREKS
ncbi:hypothetical protein Tfer_2773 [Thermincola ferriacetica]|uniref:Uncharacterized protein n=1 Tax=Thermincola ferriacetica TaxID=281456 RepID=A0A0L6VZI5_9FIRM|nr:hypothetical protein [Thermincola ferriacetica]KNZ68680.1 hypothetical protein Tfer_2773 [Thermincola ferriacetica]